MKLDELKLMLRDGLEFEEEIEITYRNKSLRGVFAAVKLVGGKAFLSIDCPDHLNPKVTKPRKPRTTETAKAQKK